MRSSASAVMSCVGGLALSVASLVLPSSAAAGAAKGICSQFTTARVSAILGVKAATETTTTTPNVTLCWYKVGPISHAVFVRVQTHDSAAGFASDKKLAATYGEKPVADKHFAPYSAFSTALGSPSYGYTYSVTVLKKSTEVDVGAGHSTLAKVESLARAVLGAV